MIKFRVEPISRLDCSHAIIEATTANEAISIVKQKGMLAGYAAHELQAQPAKDDMKGVDEMMTKLL